ncbi:MAG: response regulator transcription factor [Anaerolineae bacterium]|nr:response regulator transcription factor [Anaerolineae bacterium]
MTTRVLLADDHQLFREGLANILNGQPDFEVVGEAGDGLEAFVMSRELDPDLILMDVGMPGCDGVEATRRIKEAMPKITIVMLTVRDEDDHLFEAIKSGAQGYLLKNIRSWDLVEMLRQAVKGQAAITPALGGRMLEEFRRLSHQSRTASDAEMALTPREQEVLGLVAEGHTDQEIADRLHISIHTVKTHVRNILAKLQVSHRHEAALYARREGLIPRTRAPVTG